MDASTGIRCIAQRVSRDDISTGHPKDSLDCRGLEWTPDGTCLLSTLTNGQIEIIVVPADLLDELRQPHELQPYCSISASEPIRAVAIYPAFALQDPSSALVLSSVRDHPVQINSALTAEKLASYPLIKPTTEEYISPHALCFKADGFHFVTGSDSLICVFDVSRPGQDPLTAYSTGPKRRHRDNFNPITSMRGIISALGLDPSSNILAAGSFSRQVGLYDAGGQGECIGTFSLAGNDADAEIGGQGITQVLWSPCGRYLYVAERKSTGTMMFDIRKTGQLLSWLQGRQALTNQRLSIDLCCGKENGQEVWAGGTDGIVRRWDNTHHQEGPLSASWEMSVSSGQVPSVTVHRTGGVVATCSAQSHVDAARGVGRNAVDHSSISSDIHIWETGKLSDSA